jgi:hypothetical protein
MRRLGLLGGAVVVSCTLVPWARAAAQQQPPQLPALSTASAEGYARQVLRAQFGSTLPSPGAEVGAISKCASADRTHVLCLVHWRWSKYSFQGGVGIWYGLKAGQADWFFAYVIRRTDSKCLAGNQARPSVCVKTFKEGVLAFGASATTRTAPPWVWTESYAEKRVAGTIHYRDSSGAAAYQQGVRDRQAAVDAAQRGVDVAKQEGNPANIVAALQRLGAAEADLQAWNAANPNGGVVVYRPTDVICTGIGTAVGAIRFRQFRCVVTFGLTAHMHILATVTGRTTFRWRVI